MRRLLLLTPLLLLVACRGTQAYSLEDLRQVKQAVAELTPTYTSFKTAFEHDQAAGIKKYYRREESQCRLVDEIDNRDTIDPNVNLFQASVGLDFMCDAVESAYVYWAKKHHLPYDKTVTPGRPLEVFVGSDSFLTKMKGYLRHPAALS